MVTGIGELGTALAAISNRRTLRRNTKLTKLTMYQSDNYSFNHYRLCGLIFRVPG
jgi:hypothetical protein